MLADKKMMESMREHGIPENIRGGIYDYIAKGVEPCGFLVSVLSGNLYGACIRADSANKGALVEIVEWLWNFAPALSIGSDKKFNTWIRNGGLMGGHRS
jgi:hypothetical protein